MISKEEIVGKELGRRIKKLFVYQSLHPDEILISLIDEVYGHVVDESKLVELIESSLVGR